MCCSAGTQFLNFVIEYLHNTVFAYSYGAQLKSFEEKTFVETCGTVPLTKQNQRFNIFKILKSILYP